MKRGLIFLFLVPLVLLASVYSERPIVDFSAEPTTFVHGCVNVISGSCSYKDSGLRGGCEPLEAGFFYHQQATRQNDPLPYCWSMTPATRIALREGTGPKNRGTVWSAYLETAGGGYVPFVSPVNQAILTLDPGLYAQGLTNYGFGELSGKTCLKNRTIYVYKDFIRKDKHVIHLLS